MGIFVEEAMEQNVVPTFEGENVAPVTPAVPSVKSAGKEAAAEDFTARGKAILASDPEALKIAGSKSGTLHIDAVLGLYNKDTRQKKGPEKERVQCNRPIGFIIHSDEDIQVPVIDPALGDPRNKWSPLAPESIQYKDVKAGEQVQMTYMEMVYLISKIEYSGLAESDGDPRGFSILFKSINKYLSGESALPCVTFGFKNKSIKEQTIAIDDGKTVFPEYAEKFGYFMRPKATAPRGGSSVEKEVTPKAVLQTAQLRSILGI